MPDFGLEIMSRSDLPAIVARWQREITEAELRHGYLAILNAGDGLHCWRWLLDLRRREELASPSLTTWLDTEFFPLLVGRYPAPVRMAFLISPLRATQMQSATSAATLSTTNHSGQGYQSALFTDEAAAYQWLAE
jgi:hypothetical protein